MTDPTSADRSIPGLTIIGSAGSRDVSQAIIGTPTFRRPISGAIGLEFTLADVAPDYPLLNDPLLTAWSYATYDQGGRRINFELTSIGKGTGTDVKIGYTDAVAVHLTRQTGALTIPAGTMTRQAIAQRLAREAGVEILVDPAQRGVVNAAVERKAESNSWALLGTLADDAGWRRLSDGQRVLFGSDEWLTTLVAPQTFRENTGGVGPISFDLNVATPANSLTMVVDAELWGVPAGAPFDVAGLGLASGVWLVEEFTRPLRSVRGSVTGTRRQLVIPEPPPEQTEVAGEAGEQAFLPSSSGASTVPPAGKYGGRSITGESMAIAVTITKVAAARSLGKAGAVAGIMCGLQESGLRNLAGGDRDSVGVFQQRPSQGWGTVAQCRNVEYAAGKFYDGLAKVSGWQSLAPTVAIQRVQRSAYPDAYAKHQPVAQAIVDAIVKANSSASSSTSTTSATSSSGGTGLDRVADAGIALAGKVKVYRFGGKTLAGLDCSGFVALTTRNVGRELAGGSKQQIAAALKAGVGCSVAEGLRTRGAILFRGSTEPSHIAFSLGDGRTVEARGTADGVGIFDGAARRTWTASAKYVP